MKDFFSKIETFWKKYQEKKMVDLDAKKIMLEKELAVKRLETQIKKEKLKSSAFTRKTRKNNIDRIGSLFKGNIKPIKFSQPKQRRDKDIFSSNGFFD